MMAQLALVRAHQARAVQVICWAARLLPQMLELEAVLLPMERAAANKELEAMRAIVMALPAVLILIGIRRSLRDWVKSVQAKDIGDLAKIARDNQLALRESGRIKVPGEGATPEEVKAFHKATGVPDDAKGYELPVVKGPDGHDVKLDDGILGRLSESALKYGIPKAAYQGLINDFVGLQLDQVAHGDVEQQQLADKWVKEQGANLNARTAAINSALSSLGLSGEDAKAIRCAIGADRALAMFAKLGEGMQEDVMITGGKGRFGIDGAAAQAEIDKLKTDSAWLGKAMQPGTPENMRYNRLNEAAGEWEARKRAAA
jgi:hypothetical protein